MKRVDLNAIVLYDGELHRVTAIADGRTVTLEPVAPDLYGLGDVCPACGHGPRQVSLLEDSMLFQERVEPVKTVEGS